MEFQRKDLLIHTDFITMISITLFHCFEKVFTPTKMWMIEKSLVKFLYLRKKIFTVT